MLALWKLPEPSASVIPAFSFFGELSRTIEVCDTTAKSLKLVQIWCTIICEPKMQIAAQSTLSIPSHSAL